MPAPTIKRATAASVAAAASIAILAGGTAANADIISGNAAATVDGHYITIYFTDVVSDYQYATEITCQVFVNPSNGSPFSQLVDIDIPSKSGSTVIQGQPGYTYYFTASCTDTYDFLTIPVYPNPVTIPEYHEENYDTDYEEYQEEHTEEEKKHHNRRNWMSNREGSSYARTVLDRIFG
ncbi:hypothetical protein [Hoyosella subflava]|uniref:Uncharacterized protein n=1 Tax=Hoyosella subflava (strain DSM 45089 / JCM 17490 / NBRC 109087 / DQS3-9A1) TaxID=443218 RepID=F6EK04_HOYSD|nr:hypothetical protein [Hoyosella subflava]AEF41362.1 hypothetical protein AS9A_2915 [Hoyosella subflava DQS3-9A1]